MSVYRTIGPLVYLILVWDLIGNLEDRFSHNKAQIMLPPKSLPILLTVHYCPQRVMALDTAITVNDTIDIDCPLSLSGFFIRLN